MVVVENKDGKELSTKFEDNYNNDNEMVIHWAELHDPLQQVFDLLPVQDLQALSRVSRRFLNAISEYCEGRYHKIQSALEKVFENQLKTRKDDELQNKLKEEPSSLYRCAVLEKLLFLRRQSVVGCDVMEGNNPQCYVTEYDTILGRKILRLIKSCWIYLSGTFSDVTPGTYQAVIRMDVTQRPIPRPEIYTTLSVMWSDSDGNHDLRTYVDEFKWQTVQVFDYKGNISKTDWIDLGGGWVACNYEEPWVDVCLKEFHAGSVCDVRVRMMDCNVYCKSCIRWDYMEIKPH